MKKIAILMSLMFVCSLPLVAFAGAEKVEDKSDISENKSEIGPAGLSVAGDLSGLVGGCDDDGDGWVTLEECEGPCGGTADEEAGICWVDGPVGPGGEV